MEIVGLVEQLKENLEPSIEAKRQLVGSLERRVALWARR